ncbi:hypothetical protein Fot_42007 [Forsythia ovata]|uniref:Uncharacterized protein n=1 Tax=Forsythia ovata TaxID=205694 RepID=A0ABD1RJY9_9LAMI
MVCREDLQSTAFNEKTTKIEASKLLNQELKSPTQPRPDLELSRPALIKSSDGRAMKSSNDQPPPGRNAHINGRKALSILIINEPGRSIDESSRAQETGSHLRV